MNAFVDTNVLLDVIARREPFYHDSASVWTLAEHRKIVGFVSAVSFTNIYYISRRLSSVERARLALRLLRDTFVPVPLRRARAEPSHPGRLQGF